MTGAIVKGYVQTKAGEVHYRLCRGSAKGPAPVVFIHRSPMSGATFDAVFRKLAGWRTLVAFDVPGFGQSSPVPEGTSLPQIAGILSDAMRRLRISRPHLVGHHSGCALAAEIAVAPRSGVRSIMLDGAMIADAESSSTDVPAAALPKITREGEYLKQAWAFLQPYYTVFEPQLVHDGLIGAMQSLFTRGPTMTAIRKHDLGSALKRISCPVLASAAADDVFAPHLDRVLAIRPDTEIHRYGLAGIASPELQADVFAELVRRSVALGEATL